MTILQVGRRLPARFYNETRIAKNSGPTYNQSMYIVIKKFKSAEIEKAIENARTGFLPAVSKVPGFVDYHVIKSADDMITSVLLFDSKEGADASTTLSKQWIHDNGFDTLYELQDLTAGEVVVKG